jgi:hypothetical protein
MGDRLAERRRGRTSVAGEGASAIARPVVLALPTAGRAIVDDGGVVRSESGGRLEGGRGCALSASVGFVVGEVLTNRIRVDVAAQRLVERPAVMVAVVALVAATVSAMICWARRSPSVDRWAYLTAVLVTGGLAAGFQAAAAAVGWFSGTAFKPPLAIQALVYGLSLTGSVALVLGGYRLGAARRKRLALTAYAGLLVVAVTITVVADRALLDSGVYRFERGYTIATDVCYGIALYLLPLLLYLATAPPGRPAPPKAPDRTPKARD